MTEARYDWPVLKGRLSCRMTIGFLAVACGMLALAIGQAHAAGDTIKVGLVFDMTGPFADFGRQMTNGVKTFIKQNGDAVAGKKIELVVRDTGGPAPELAKRLCQELAVKEKVDFLAGFTLTPNALACTQIATEAKKPMILMMAATSIITTKSPYIARTSLTVAQVTEPMAQWAFKNGYRKVYTLVADYGPGFDAEKAFKKVFTKLGGEVVGELRVPLKNPDFGPFVQRVKDSKPQAMFVFLPAGETGVAFMKSYTERGLAKAGIKLLATGDVVDDGMMDVMGDTPLGAITTYFYSAAHQSPENEAFLAAYKQVDPTTRPNGLAMGAYDGMAAIYAVAKQLNGKIDGDKAMQVLKGLKLNSPRGPIQLDPDTRDIVQNVYVREARKVGDKVYNVEFETFNAVKDPGK